MGGSQMRGSRMGATQAGVGTNDHRVSLPAWVDLYFVYAQFARLGYTSSLNV